MIRDDNGKKVTVKQMRRELSAANQLGALGRLQIAATYGSAKQVIAEYKRLKDSTRTSTTM